MTSASTIAKPNTHTNVGWHTFIPTPVSYGDLPAAAWILDTGNSSEPFIDVDDLEHRLTSIIALAHEQVFEDGMESDYSRTIVQFVERYEDRALNLLYQFILDKRIGSEATHEALRWIGDIADPLTEYSRRIFLERCLLTGATAQIRDGALLGLASMDDPASVANVRLALDQETSRLMRQSLQQLLEQLEQTATEYA